MLAEITDDAADAIVRESLREILEGFQSDLANKRYGMFSHDPEEDTKEIKKLMKAFRRVLNFYEGYS